MYKNHSKGFTLIELLVVIGIIGILSAVVLASLNTARFKGNDAAIQSDLSAVQTQAEIYYGGAGSNSYGTQAFGTDATCDSTGAGMFTDATIKKALDGAFKAGGSAVGSVACVAASQTYAVAVKLTANAPEWWCVDSTGSAKKKTGAVGELFPVATFTC
jgi:prepilin-type N-terminal cleavage/methylation domain-containing protein